VLDVENNIPIFKDGDEDNRKESIPKILGASQLVGNF
jgi:hypothetical protein